MHVDVQPLESLEQTGRQMVWLAVSYAQDMAQHADLDIEQLFELLRLLPYREDPETQEWVQRPAYTLDPRSKHGDCDDKAICVGAWCVLRRTPFRFVSVRGVARNAFHHVLTDVGFPEGWVRVDPTYSHNILGSRVPYAEELTIGAWNP